VSSLHNFVDRLRQTSNWLPEQQWAQWCLIAMAAAVFFLLLLKIIRRKKRHAAVPAQGGPLDQSAQSVKATYASGMSNAQPVSLSRNQQFRTDPTELVAHPEISIRQLRREIFKRDRAEARLEHEIEELKIANAHLRHLIAESKKRSAYFEKKVAELTASNEKMGQAGKQKEAEAEARKQCRKCKKNKPLTEFHKNASSSDGLARWCKSCKTKAAKESRRKRAAERLAAEQRTDMCADAPLCVLHHRQTDRIKNARRRAGHAANKLPENRQTERRPHRFRSQLSSPGLRCPRRQKQREQGK